MLSCNNITFHKNLVNQNIVILQIEDEEANSMSSFATIRSSQGSAVGMQAPHKLKKGEAVLLPLPPHLLEKGEVALPPLPPHLLKKLLKQTPKLKIRYRRTLNQSSDTFESFVEEKSPVPLQKPRNQAGLQEMSYASIVASSTAQSNTLVPQQKLRHRKTLNMPKSARDQIKLSVSPLKQRHRKTFVQQVKSCDVLNSQNFPQDMDWQISTQKGPKLHTKQTEIPVDESYYSALSSDDICDTEIPNTPVSNLTESNNAQRKQKRVKTKHSSKASVHQILPQTPVKPLPVVEPVTNDPIQDDMHQYVLDLQNFCPDIRVETQNGVEVIISNAQQQRLWCFSQNDEQQFFVDDIGFTLWRTPADGACLFHALVLVLSHWELTAKQYQNVITLRETIWKVLDKLNKKNDPWLLELFNTFTDLKTEPERNKYIQDIRRPKTWGSRIEIMMFCLLYDCEIKIAHAVEGERFSFDSTRDALQLIKTKIPRLNMPYFKNTIRLNKNPGYNIKRIGYIGSVFSNNPFALDERIPKNHFVFLRHQNSTFDFFRNLEKSRRISIVHNLGLCLEFEGAKALKDILLETKKRKFTKISPKDKPARIRPWSKYALQKHNISRNRKSALNKGSNLENSDTRPLSQVWDELDPNQPLHLNQHVINAMEEARDKMQALKPPSPPCTHCHRWWPDMEIKIKQPTIDTDDESPNLYVKIVTTL